VNPVQLGVQLEKHWIHQPHSGDCRTKIIGTFGALTHHQRRLTFLLRPRKLL
jgi:hypothetical protein